MKRRTAWGLLTCALFLLCPYAGMGQELKRMSRQTTDYFSTVSMLILYVEPDETERFSQAWTDIKAMLSQIDQAVSLSRPDSDISRFNALACGESVAVSDITADILRTAMDVYVRTDGLYDPTVYPLVDLWGFSPRFNRNTYVPSMPYDRAYADSMLPLPDEAHIRALLPLVGLDGIRLYRQDGQWRLQKNTPSIQLEGVTIHAQMDLGGIAKGYACDRVKQYLDEHSLKKGHFVCGESSMAILARPTQDGLYDLTLGKPRPGSNDRSSYATLSVRDMTLSTSSDATHAYMIDGVRYCHIIDPRTGRPVNPPNDKEQRGAASITLLCGCAAFGDAMSTALFLMTPQEAAAYMSIQLRGDQAVAVYYRTGADTLEVMTTLPDEAMVYNDPAYLPASHMEENGLLCYTGAFFSLDSSEDL